MFNDFDDPVDWAIFHLNGFEIVNYMNRRLENLATIPKLLISELTMNLLKA